MNKPKITTAAFLGALSLAASPVSQAAFTDLPSPTPLVPGVALGAFQPTGGGTIVDSLSLPFADAFTSGILNTWVVDRDAGPGVLYDFYYQVVNAAAIPPPDLIGAEIWRLKTIGGFDGVSGPGAGGLIQVAQTDISPVTGLPVPLLQDGTSADRDEGTLGSVGFTFPVIAGPGIPQPDADNVQVGESSGFFVVRTNSSSYASAVAHISSGDTGVVGTFAAIPEPSSVLFGLAMFGVALTGRVRSRSSKTA